jgi:sensor histidine kinase regulating citrate/malate metabolism
MLTPEDFTPDKLRIQWSVILLMLAVQLIVLIVLSIVVANHPVTSSSAEARIAQIEAR